MRENKRNFKSGTRSKSGRKPSGKRSSGDRRGRDSRGRDSRRYDSRGRDSRRIDEKRSFKPSYDEMQVRDDVIFGRNPVTEAIRSGRDIEKVLVQKGAGGSLGRIISMASEKGFVIEEVEKPVLERISCGGSHQGVLAYVAVKDYAELEDIFANAEKKGEEPFVIVLDGIEDPHNLGAIMRTAECAGAHGVIIPKRHAVGLTQTVAKASAGAIEYMPCVKVSNIPSTIQVLKEKGLWVYACDMDGEYYTRQKLTGAMALVVGAEGSGVSRLVRENCDFVLSIPMLGSISSLNASNAAAVLMYEVRRQRDGQK